MSHDRYEPPCDLPHATGRAMLERTRGDVDRACEIAAVACERAKRSADRMHWRDALAWLRAEAFYGPAISAEPVRRAI